MDKKDKYRYLWLRVSYAVIRGEYIQKLGIKAFAIFIVIRTYMNQEGVAFPSLSTIARFSGCSTRTVQDGIKKLVQMKWIEKRKTRSLNGKYERNRYQILQDDLIRGTDQPSFTDHPSEKIADGD